MRKRPDLNELSKKVCQSNKDKGFHKVDHGNEELLMLVITDLSDAIISSFNKKKTFEINYFFKRVKGMEEKDYIFYFDMMFRNSLEDKLADALIGLLDLIGLRNYDAEPQHQEFADRMIYVFKNNTLIYSIYFIIENITSRNCYEKGAKEKVCITYIDALCECLNFDLWLYIELKLKYNELKPSRQKLYFISK